VALPSGLKSPPPTPLTQPASATALISASCTEPVSSVKALIPAARSVPATAGFLAPDSGSIFIDGEEVKLRSVTHARQLGIETVYQDLALIDELPVYLNMNLNKEPVRRPFPFLDKKRMRAEARAKLDDMGVRIASVDTEVAFLSGGQRQAIAIARAVYSDARILLLDEPLAAMGAKESRIILDLMNELKKRADLSIVMIAHNFAQIIDVCDRVNLLQHGRITYDKSVANSSVKDLTDLISAEYRGGSSSDQTGE